MNCGNCRYGQEMLIDSGRVFEHCPIMNGIILYHERQGVYYELVHGGDKNWQCLNSISSKHKQKVNKTSKCDCWSSKQNAGESDVRVGDRLANYTCDGQTTLGDGGWEI